MLNHLSAAKTEEIVHQHTTEEINGEILMDLPTIGGDKLPS